MSDTQKYLINIISSINSNNVCSGPVVESVFPLVFSFIHRAQPDYRRGGVAICSRSSLEYGILPWGKIKCFEHLGWIYGRAEALNSPNNGIKRTREISRSICSV